MSSSSSSTSTSTSTSTSSPSTVFQASITAGDAAWSARAQSYDQVATPFTQFYAQKLIEKVSLDSRLSVLDVACGSGAVSLLAARSGAQVIASDFAEGMLELVRKYADERGFTNIRTIRQDAQTLQGLEPASIDVIFINFGIFFVQDVEAALKRMRELLKEGGSLVFSTWAAYSDSPLHRVLASLGMVVKSSIPTEDELNQLTPENWVAPPLSELPPPPYYPDPSIVKQKLIAAGFDAKFIESQQFSCPTPSFASMEEFLTKIVTSTPGIGNVIGSALPQRRKEMLIKLERLLREVGITSKPPTNFAIGTSAWVHFAKKSS